MRESTARRNTLRRVQKDLLRRMRVVETLDTAVVFANSPVEVKEGYIVSDRDNGEVFLVLVFRCLSQKPVEALDIRVHLYHEQQPVPFSRTDFRYSHETATLGERVLNGQSRKEKECKRETAIVHGEEFGQGIFLPLPENYFHKMQIELVGVTYADGSYDTLKLLAGERATRFDDMDSGLRTSYTHLNIFGQAEEEHPIRVLPQAGENAWLCCCGHKNPAALSLCETCRREKEWQLANLSEEHLRQVRRELDEEEEKLVKARKKRVLRDTSTYPQTRYLENAEERLRKAEQFSQSLDNLAAQEKARARRLKRIPLWIGLVVLAVWLLTKYDDIITFIRFLMDRT